MVFRKFLIDTSLSVMVFVPITVLWNRFVWDTTNVNILLGIAAGSLIVNAAAGGFYGRILNVWRQKLRY